MVCLLHHAQFCATSKKKKVLSALVGFGAVAEMVIIDTKVLFKRQNKFVPTLKNLLTKRCP